MASAVQVVNLPSVSAILAPGAYQQTGSAVVRTARRARATRRANAVRKMGSAALPLTSALLAARAGLANAMPALVLSRPMASAAARMDASAKVMLMENAAVSRAFVALRLLSAVLVARTPSVCAKAGQAPSQRISSAPSTGRPARAPPMATAVVRRITVAKRPLIAVLDGKSKCTHDRRKRSSLTS